MPNNVGSAPPDFVEIKIDDAIIYLCPTLDAVTEAKGLLKVYENKLRKQQKDSESV